MDRDEILCVLKEMREACAACFRVTYKSGISILLLEDELKKAHIKNGFGVRCQDLIKKLEGERVAG